VSYLAETLFSRIQVYY